MASRDFHSEITVAYSSRMSRHVLSSRSLVVLSFIALSVNTRDFSSPRNLTLMSTLLHQSQGLSGSTKGELGTCSVCGAAFKLVASTGVLRKHGHCNDRQPCAGSGRPPVIPSAPELDASVDLFLSPHSSPSPPTLHSVNSSVFNLSCPSRPTI